MKIVLRWLINVIVLLLVARFLPGLDVDGVYIAVIAALLLGLLNAVLRPLLVMLTLPINVLTLGLFTFVINGFILWFVASFVDGFDVSSFWIAMLAALILGALNSILGWLILENE